MCSDNVYLYNKNVKFGQEQAITTGCLRETSSYRRRKAKTVLCAMASTLKESEELIKLNGY